MRLTQHYLGTNRDEAEQLLANEAVGTFLVRFSSSQKPHLAVSVVSDNKAITHRLFERKGGKYWNGPQSFNTLRETVSLPAFSLLLSLLSLLVPFSPKHVLTGYDLQGGILRGSEASMSKHEGRFVQHHGRGSP